MWQALGYFLEWLAAWFPRLSVCRATHSGIKFKRGKVVRMIHPGLYVYWPIVTEVTLLPTNRQTSNLESQSLPTKDGSTVTFSLTIVYKITDVTKAIVDTDDIDDTIGDVGLRSAIGPITSRRFVEIRSGICGDVKREITRACRRALHPFGVKVIECDLTDLAKTSTYRIFGAGPTVLKDEE